MDGWVDEWIDGSYSLLIRNLSITEAKEHATLNTQNKLFNKLKNPSIFNGKMWQVKA